MGVVSVASVEHSELDDLQRVGQDPRNCATQKREAGSPRRARICTGVEGFIKGEAKAVVDRVAHESDRKVREETFESLVVHYAEERNDFFWERVERGVNAADFVALAAQFDSLPGHCERGEAACQEPSGASLCTFH